MEETLSLQQLEYFKNALDEHAIVAVTDPHGTLIYVNDKFCEISKYTRAELLGKNHRIVNSGVHDPDFWRGFWNTLKAGKVWRGEVCNRAKDGSLYWVMTTIVPCRDSTGKFCQYVAIRADITQRKAAEAALAESEERSRLIVEAASDGIILVNKGGEIASSNAALAKMLGYGSPEELIGKPLTSIMPERFRQAHHAGFTNRLSGPKRTSDFRSIEVHALRRDGKEVSIELSIGEIARQGERAFVGVIRDISDRKKMDEMQRLQNEILEGMVNERTRELMQMNEALQQEITANYRATETIQRQQNDLVQAAKMAALGHMAGGIAHEINNPLCTIGLLSEQLMDIAIEEKGDADPFVAKLATVRTTVNKIAAIVKGLRTFARDGSQDPFVVTSVKSLLDDTLSFCREKLRHADVTLEVKLPEQDLQVPCRPSQIAQVLVNLVNNAEDAVTGLQERWVRIEATEAGGWVEISITDSGSGIQPEVAEKLFTPFFTTKDVGKGTGLGLSISQGIIQSHGGRMYIDNGCRNTRFVIQLPCANQAHNPKAA